MFKVWLDLGILTLMDLQEIDRKSALFKVPYSIGRLPTNIASNYGGFKAVQWQTWITVYSPVVLKGLIPTGHFQCWLLFVRACSILSKRYLAESDVITADLLLLNFCKVFEELYGSERCTPNLHLHLHLKQCLLDYGPSHAFWCFSFERYNGLLGSFHTNNKSIEQQIMRKFINSQQLRDHTALAHPQLLSLLPSFQQEPTPSTPLIGFCLNDSDVLKMLKISSSPIASIDTFENRGQAKLLPPLHQHVLKSEKVEDLQKLYSELYPEKEVDVSPFCVRSGRAAICSQVIGSTMNAASCNSSSVISAYWKSTNTTLSNIDSTRLRIGRVNHFLKHQCRLSDASGIKRSEHIFAYVSWNQQHPHADWFGISATVCLNMHDPPSMCSFIPIQRIHAVCAHCVLDVDIHGMTERLFVAVPIPMKFCL